MHRLHGSITSVRRKADHVGAVHPILHDISRSAVSSESGRVRNCLRYRNSGCITPGRGRKALLRTVTGHQRAFGIVDVGASGQETENGSRPS